MQQYLLFLVLFIVALVMPVRVGSMTPDPRTPLGCPPLNPSLENGNVILDGTYAWYFCNAGFFLVVDRKYRTFLSRKCLDGWWGWSGEEPKCMVNAREKCDPGVLPNGHIGFDYLNSSFSYQCNDGYLLVGSAIRTCLHLNGTTFVLSDDEAKCVVDKRRAFFCSSNDEYIAYSKFCDGTPDCSDGSDEIEYNISIHTTDEGYKCRRRESDYICLLPRNQKIFKKRTCDGDQYCKAEWRYLCKGGGKCIPWQSFCDGKIDCSDGDDETPYNSTAKPINGTRCYHRQFIGDACVLEDSQKKKIETVCRSSKKCTGKEFACDSGGECIRGEMLCDGKVDCSDGSDEVEFDADSFTSDDIRCNQGWRSCVVPKSQKKLAQLRCDRDLSCPGDFLCADREKCVGSWRFCDGPKNCKDGSDEIEYDPTVHNLSAEVPMIPCRHMRQIKKVCAIPADTEDKSFCRMDASCSKEFLCGDGETCIPSLHFCDGSIHCTDNENYGSDEVPFNASAEEQKGAACRNKRYLNKICHLPPDQQYKRAYLCRENPTCEADEFMCPDSKECLPGFDFCDGIPHCRDHSDEVEYASQNSSVGILCRRNERFCLLPSDQVDKEDKLCNNDVLIGPTTFYCFNNLHPFPIRVMCDGVFDCDDASDECICNFGRSSTSKSLCDAMNWTPGSYNTLVKTVSKRNDVQQEVTWNDTCLGSLPCFVDSHPSCVPVGSVCDLKRDCDNKIDELYCQYTGVLPTGAQDKPDTDDEQCTGDPTTSSLDDECFKCDNTPPFCEYVRLKKGELIFKCEGGEIIRNHQVCDGVFDCYKREDEIGCSNWFICGNESRKAVPTEHVCDLRKDCPNYEDEHESLCGEQTRECEVCDGNTDCDSGRDECEPWCIDSIFSSTESLISSKATLPFIWIISLTALFGNLLVIAFSIRGIVSATGRSSSIEKGQLVLVLNLAAADLLVGVYTSSICWKNTSRERYCIIDQEWRSSIGCSILGAILVIGSEESVMALTIITAFRLLAVARPFTKPSMRTFCLCMALSWAASLLMALIPFAASTEDYFTDSIWFSENPLFTTLEYKDVPTLSERLVTLLNKTEYMEKWDAGSWSLLEELIPALNPSFKPQRYFGYYSAHGVCLPRLFPDPYKIAAWSFSLLIIIINFTSFIFIFVAYIFIFRRATQTDVRKSSVTERTAKLQKRVTRIVVSDFLCWMPVCIMVLMQISGINISKDVYIPVGMILIPINSALNPFLYSNAPEWLYTKFLLSFNWIRGSVRSMCGRARGQTYEVSPQNRPTPQTSSTQMVASQQNSHPENVSAGNTNTPNTSQL